MKVITNGARHLALVLGLQLGLSALLCVTLYKTDRALTEVAMANREDTLVSSLFSRIYCKLLHFELSELVDTSLTRICDSQVLSDRDPDLISRCAVYDKNTAPIDVDLSVSEFLQQGTKKRLVCLVDARDILDLARTEHSKIALDKAPCSLNELILNALDAVASDPRSRNVELSASNAAQDDTIQADEAKLLRALIGLLKSLLSPDGQM